VRAIGLQGILGLALAVFAEMSQAQQTENSNPEDSPMDN